MSDPDRATVREGVPGDTTRLRAIQRTTLDHYWPELLETALDGPPLVLVLETDQPIGYALVVPGDGVAYLAELAITPPQQGRGYGTELLESLLERLRTTGFEKIRLTTRADDDRVRAFYERFDFAVVDEVPDHYGKLDEAASSGEDTTRGPSGDAVVMARDL